MASHSAAASKLAAVMPFTNPPPPKSRPGCSAKTAAASRYASPSPSSRSQRSSTVIWGPAAELVGFGVSPPKVDHQGPPSGDSDPRPRTCE